MNKMKKGEIVYYKYKAVEILEIDYEFNLTLIKFINSQKIEYLNTKQLSNVPVNESFISLNLLKGEKLWF